MSSDVATYGEELMHHIAGHLVHVCGTFGFVGDARLVEGHNALVADSQALASVAFRVFDADGDGVVTPDDLATVLSLAKPFFHVTHVALETKFAAALGEPSGGSNGVTEDEFSKIMQSVPLLNAWTLVPVRRTAEWLARRAHVFALTGEDVEPPSPPPPPNRLLPPPGRGSRREELERAARGELFEPSNEVDTAGLAQRGLPNAEDAFTPLRPETAEERHERKGYMSKDEDHVSSIDPNKPGAEEQTRRDVKPKDGRPKKKMSHRPYAYAAVVATRGKRNVQTPGSTVGTSPSSNVPAGVESHIGSGLLEESSGPSLAEQEIALEKKMRAEVLAKQQQTLSGKANTKEWNYSAYAHRSRRIEPVLGNTKRVDLDRVTSERVAVAKKKKALEGKRRW